MAERKPGVRLASVLWFIAAGLAWTAVAIRYYRRDELSWPWAAAGLFCIAMGASAWARSRSHDSLPANRDRGPAA
jgi:hypothetical protein